MKSKKGEDGNEEEDDDDARLQCGGRKSQRLGGR
jgi:hypothetical protein